MSQTQVTVRSIPAPGSEVRFRAKRPWGKAPVPVLIVDAPDRAAVSPIEISPLELAQLKRDPLIVVQEMGGTDPQLVDVKTALAEAEAKIVELRGELAGYIEAAELERGKVVAEAEVAGAKIRELEALTEQLRADLAKGSVAEVATLREALHLAEKKAEKLEAKVDKLTEKLKAKGAEE